MKKILMISIPFLFIFSCTNSKLDVEEEVVIDYEHVIFKDKVLENGVPVQGAIVSVYGNGQRYFDETDAKGEYSIVVPSESLLATGFISLNISHSDYKPLNVTYKAPLLSNSTYDSKSIAKTIVKCNNCLRVKNANATELYHLGDDNFSGTANSQFQKNSDGIETFFSFVNTIGDDAKLKITFEAKGLQPDRFNTPAMVVFGNQSIHLEESPEDGSYQKYALEFDNDKTIETIEFRTSEPRSATDLDVDDWEFTSFYIEGID